MIGRRRDALGATWRSCPRVCSGTRTLPLCHGDRVEHASEESLALGCKRVHDHLPLPARTDEPRRAKRAKVVRDEVGRALANPGEVADAELVGLAQGGG